MAEVMIRLDSGSVSASVHGETGTVLALGHGAGGNRKNRFLLDLAEVIASTSRRAVLYNFPYTERRARIPDPPDKLEATVAAVTRHVRESFPGAALVLGGKSMGGRIASQAVAKGLAVEGLVFLGYPLHPPGRTEKLRSAHLPSITAPMLFVQGTRDAFARMDLLTAALAPLGARATLFELEGADHSFRVPRKAEPVEARIHAEIVRWLGGRGL